MSSSKYLPAVVAQEGLVRLQQAIQTGDPRMVELVIAWGYEGIERAFNPDPLFAPLDGVRRHRAKREWQQIVRGMQRQLQEVMAQKQVEAFTYNLDRGLNNLKYQDREEERQQSALFDSHIRIEEHKAIASFDSQLRREELAAMGQIQQAAAQAAPASDPWQEVARIQAEMSRIANDPTMSSAEKHRQTVPLQQALTQKLASLGK